MSTCFLVISSFIELMRLTLLFKDTGYSRLRVLLKSPTELQDDIEMISFCPVRQNNFSKHMLTMINCP